MRIFRSAQDQDFAVIANISELIYQNMLSLGHPAFFNWSNGAMLAELKQASQVWVAEENAQILAFIVLRELSDAWEVSALASNPLFWGRGCMSSLLSDVIERFTRGDNGKEIWLEVHEENHPARQLYQKLGLVEVGRRSRYYSDGGSAVLYSYQR